jgi:DNA polymerase-3 subunit beta
MKVVCNRKRLMSDCLAAKLALPTSMETPKVFKAIANSGGFSLVAGGQELVVRLEDRDADVSMPGEAILPAAKLIDILRASSDDKLIMESRNGAASVRCGRAKFEMPGMDQANVPDVPTFDDKSCHEHESSALRQMIRRIIFAASDNVCRHSLPGILWELDKDCVRLVATDGFRLALARGAAKACGGRGTNMSRPVVPTGAMLLLWRILADEKETALVDIRRKEVLFRTSRAAIWSRLAPVVFPDYHKLIPKRPTVDVAFNASEFTAAIRQAAVMAEKEKNEVVFQFSRGKLALFAGREGIGRSNVELPLRFQRGSMTISFNSKRLIGMLRELPRNAQLTMEIVDGRRPVMFKSGTEYSCLISPLS